MGFKWRNNKYPKVGSDLVTGLGKQQNSRPCEEYKYVRIEIQKWTRH